MKLVTILGARPQFIKVSVVSAELVKHRGVEEVMARTGQHFDSNMPVVFFAELGTATRRHQLGIHRGMRSALTGRASERTRSHGGMTQGVPKMRRSRRARDRKGPRRYDFRRTAETIGTCVLVTPGNK